MTRLIAVCIDAGVTVAANNV